MRLSLSRLSLAVTVALLSPLVRVPVLGSQEMVEPTITYSVISYDVRDVRMASSDAIAWAKSDDDITIDDIGRVKRGKEHVLVHADVGKAGLTCKLKLKYADGNADSPDDVESDKHGICDIYFDAPDRKTAVGDAIAKLKVVTSKNEDRGKAARMFSVRDGRN